ncbi:hypothetical protein TRP8649_03778 [Pelagimonas phthalicica]|uniref:Uncharacterized protein n=1 Tax=Pelagimonas phthalicica TaxID=1037362 RepID=A0A238JG29_9RHOB|nr:hypothetical protein [Pelagimonas phthalicica]TDS89185.1 hypothetical protein CLV87_4375 [Pelagimonas phthalicica]SMX29640.1 hypothetical protein TRP8649_03778 [Pelagimonas phthalicica]
MGEMRAPETVMTLSRLGSLHQCRLSFMRQLTRRMAREGWAFTRRAFQIDAQGVGHAVYTAQGPERAYSLIAFAHDLPPDMRSDRVIATAWDATFTLFDGIPSAADIQELAKNVPLQEAGRVSESSLSVSRANRSVRLWEHVVDALSKGQQPAKAQLEAVGYLMRTTAVYGSGKLGAADREMTAQRPEMQAPFQVEMLSVFLTRWFVRDLVEHMAQQRGGDTAVPLDPVLAQDLGIGNSTGLGMAPYIVNHPILFNNWITAREQAIAKVRALPSATPEQVALFRDLVTRSQTLVARWRSDHPLQIVKLSKLTGDMAALQTWLAAMDLSDNTPWNRLMLWAEDVLSEEGQELIASLILEPYGDLVDALGAEMADSSGAFIIDGAMPIGKIRELIHTSFGPLLDLDWSARENCARAWYVSEEKLEPRLGERFEEPVADYEQPLAPARDAAAALATLSAWQADTPVADFLAQHPEHRHTIRRAQIAQIAPYGEIRSNTIGADVLPIDMLRAKLSFFGVTRFDPRSDRWVRVNMYSGAPYPQDLTPANADLWVYPEATS